MDNKTAFLEIFGDSPILKVLDFLIVNEEFDQSMTTIAEEAEVGYSTLKIFWPKLEKEGIVINTRVVGKAKMYKLNMENPIMKKFRDFYWAATKHHVNEMLNRKEIVAR